MASVSVDIFEARSAATARLIYEVVVRDAAGQPAAGEDVAITIDGSGSLSPKFSAKEIRRDTDADGTAIIAWYRSGIWDRDVKATLTAKSSNEALSVSLEPLSQEAIERLDGPRIRHIRSKLF